MRGLLNDGVRAAAATRPVTLQATDQLRASGFPPLQQRRFVRNGLVFTDWFPQAATWNRTLVTFRLWLSEK
jgi:hypothetical protein